MSALETLTKTPLPKKIFFLALLMLLLGAGFWFSFYSPVTEEYAAAKSKHDELVRKLDTAQKRKHTYDQDRLRRDEMQKSSTKQFQALPPETEMSSFLASLNAQADVVGLEILSVKPLQEEAAEYYARIPVQLELEGTFHQLAKFFFLIGSLDRIINVENINLRVVALDQTNAVLRAGVLATTFRSVHPGDAKGKAAGGKAKKPAKGKSKPKDEEI
ncbi:MAG: type 4a pilus biogenesis protein PilO [Proteobacteria bacterium]|jgi:type IV pilus assembly protein PilO|nr:type 4a pilus biogenesis protein PilO [Pseudomonadota bacterium]